MKTKIIILAIIFLSLAVVLNAQPSPPTTPYGTPVPVGGLSLILLAAGGLLVFFRKKNKKE